MANVNSTEYANAVATPPVKNRASYEGGKIRTMCATYTQGAADGTLGDVVYFGALPANARVLDGSLSWGTGNASATLAIGTTGTTASKLLAATAITTASTAPTAVVAHLASGLSMTTGATGDVVIGTNAGAAIKAAQAITLIVRYVVD